MPKAQTRSKVDTRLLVDQFVKVRAARSKAEKQYNQLRTAILALDRKICEGTNCKAVILERSRQSLDTAALKAEFGLEWYEDWCQTTEYQEIEVVQN